MLVQIANKEFLVLFDDKERGVVVLLTLKADIRESNNVIDWVHDLNGLPCVYSLPEVHL